MNKNILVIFTSTYPYGNKAETFLETEIKYLSSQFKKIYIIPSGKESNQIRKTPYNIECVDILIQSVLKNKNKYFIKNLLTVIHVYFYTIFKKGNLKYYVKNFKIYLDILIQEIWKSKCILSFIREKRIENELFYDYWFENSTLALSLLKKRKKINSFFCRIHGFDLYDDRWATGKVPFREFKIQYLDSVFAISEHGKKYLMNHIQKKYHSKIKLCYLGVNQFEKSVVEKNNKQPLIISCSSLQPFKQVDLIIEALKYITMPLKWIHFGSGPLEEKLRNQSLVLPSNIVVDFKGHVSNAEIIDFYINNTVDLFISLSRTEGLPVSIMEAISFGIPVLATDVNGVSEIVQEQTGLLVTPNESPLIIAQKIESLLNNKLNPLKILDFYNDHFNAEKNYISFIHQIKFL